jgi:hypothetical protein
MYVTCLLKNKLAEKLEDKRGSKDGALSCKCQLPTEKNYVVKIELIRKGIICERESRWSVARLD